MAIAASLPTLNTQILQALSMGTAAQSTTVATIISLGVASAALTGQMVAGPILIPVIPAGLSATQSLMTQSLNMGNGAQPSTVAQMMAQAVSLCAPLVPPVGLAVLQTQILQALSLGNSVQPSTVAQMMAQGIINYFQMGLVI